MKMRPPKLTPSFGRSLKRGRGLFSSERAHAIGAQMIIEPSGMFYVETEALKFSGRNPRMPRPTVRLLPGLGRCGRGRGRTVWNGETREADGDEWQTTKYNPLSSLSFSLMPRAAVREAVNFIMTSRRAFKLRRHRFSLKLDARGIGSESVLFRRRKTNQIIRWSNLCRRNCKTKRSVFLSETAPLRKIHVAFKPPYYHAENAFSQPFLKDKHG